jgi:hypothetical protein
MVEEATSATVQPQRPAKGCLSHVQNGIQANVQLKDGSDPSDRTEPGVLPLTEMARKFGQRDALIGCDIEGWITRAIPAVVSNSSSEPRVKYVERGIRWDMPNANPAPWADIGIKRAQLGTLSYVAASSAKTRSTSPRSINCSAVSPSNTGSGVAMNRTKPSGV